MMATAKQGLADASYLERAADLLDGPKRAGVTASTWPGGDVLDVGCGTGIDTVALGEAIGPNGTVHGVDHDPAMVRAADERAAAMGRPAAPVTHRRADATALPYGSASFDVCRAERVLQHAADPRAVVREMVRVTRPGGRIVLVDTDWASMSLAGGDRGFERRLTAELLTIVPSAAVGRELPALLLDAGCTDVEVEPFVVAFTDLALTRAVTRLDAIGARAVGAGRVAAGEWATWLADAEALDAAGGFYGYAVMSVATGTVRP